MRYLVPLIILGCIATIVMSAATPAVHTVTCPLCHKVIKNKTPVSGIYVGGEVIPVHFECNFNEQMRQRELRFAQKLQEMRKSE